MLTPTLFFAAVLLIPVVAVGTIQDSALAVQMEHGSDADLTTLSDASKPSISQVLFHRGSGRCPRTNPC